MTELKLTRFTIYNLSNKYFLRIALNTGSEHWSALISAGNEFQTLEPCARRQRRPILLLHGPIMRRLEPPPRVRLWETTMSDTLGKIPCNVLNI